MRVNIFSGVCILTCINTSTDGTTLLFVDDTPMIMSRYALETLMGRVPLPRVLFEYFDEVFCLGLLLVEWKSVHSGDALLGERLFGLRRSRRIYIQQNSMRTNEVVTPSGSVKKKRSFTNAMVPLSFRCERARELCVIPLFLSGTRNL